MWERARARVERNACVSRKPQPRAGGTHRYLESHNRAQAERLGIRKPTIARRRNAWLSRNPQSRAGGKPRYPESHDRAQAAVLPAALHGRRDVIGAAETGSGKTLAFGLPILHRLLEEEVRKCVGLVGLGLGLGFATGGGGEQVCRGWG